MDIAALSTAMSLQRVQQQVSVSVLDKAVNTEAAAVQNLLQQMLVQPEIDKAMPFSTHILDTYA